MENSFHVPDAVPALFMADHWWPHSSMRVRAAAFLVMVSSPLGPDEACGVGVTFDRRPGLGVAEEGGLTPLDGAVDVDWARTG